MTMITMAVKHSEVLEIMSRDRINLAPRQPLP